MRRYLLGICIGLLIAAPPLWALRVSRPPEFSEWNTNTFSQLNQTLLDLWNISNGRFTLDVGSSSPNGVVPCTKGDIRFRDQSGNYYIDICTSTQVWTTFGSASEKFWSFNSPPGGSGTFYFGGYYKFGASNNDFSPAITFGTANASYAAHFFVVLGEPTVDTVTITVSGTSITDAGVRTAADSETITIPSGTAAHSYYETDLKWLGQITVSTTAGTAKNCNYGFAKYWDNNNTDFKVIGVEATWLGGGNDATPDIRLLHHKATGWTYNAGSTPTPPTAIASMATDHTTEIQVVNNEEGAWKRSNLNTSVNGSGSEGTIVQITTTANNTFEQGMFILRIRPD